MSIDLDITTSKPLKISSMKAGIKKTLNEVCEGVKIPDLEILKFEQNKYYEPNNFLNEDSGPHIVKTKEYEACVMINMAKIEDNYIFTVSPCFTRSNMEYVISAATAIYVASLENSNIEDGFSFWTGFQEISHFQFSTRIKTKNKKSFQEACDSIMCKI